MLFKWKEDSLYSYQ